MANVTKMRAEKFFDSEPRTSGTAVRCDFETEEAFGVEIYRSHGDAEPATETSDAQQEPIDFLRELMERKFCQWLLAYLAFAFMGLQMIDVLAEVWSWSALFQRATTLVLGLGAIPAAVVAWFHGERGRQKVCLAEVALLGVLSVGCAMVIWRIIA